MRAGTGLLLVLMLGLSGCNRTPPMIEVPAGAGAPQELGATLNVRVEGDSVRLALHITNVTAGPIRLEFSSGQRYDFEVARAGGESLWRWSADRQFMQALGEETLAPGESRQFEETWTSSLAPGVYVATGWLTSTNYPVELRTTFEP